MQTWRGILLNVNEKVESEAGKETGWVPSHTYQKIMEGLANLLQLRVQGLPNTYGCMYVCLFVCLHINHAFRFMHVDVAKTIDHAIIKKATEC